MGGLLTTDQPPFFNEPAGKPAPHSEASHGCHNRDTPCASSTDNTDELKANDRRSAHAGSALINMVRNNNSSALGEVNSVVESPEFQRVEQGIQSRAGLTWDGAGSLNAKGDALQQTKAFQALLDKLPPEARQAVEEYGAIQWLMGITQKYGKQ